MKKQSTLLIAACILAGLLGVLVWFSRSTEQPYMGKTLREWIVAAPRSITNSGGSGLQMASFADQKELQAALRELGSNAVPTLVAMLDESDTGFSGAKMKAVTMPRVPQFLKSKFRGDGTTTFQMLYFVIESLKFLGDDALHAIPDLERIVCETKREMAPSFAANVLADLGYAGVSALHRCLTNAPPDRHSFIQRAITQRYERDLKSLDPETRTTDIWALTHTPKPPSAIILALLEQLESPVLETRRSALNSLSRHLPTLAPSLVVAYRAVEKQTTSDDPEMRHIASELLAKLSPPPPQKNP